MSTKETVIELIIRLPDDVSVPDIMAELYFRQKVDEGLHELDAGQGVSHEEAIGIMAQLIWSPRAVKNLHFFKNGIPAQAN
jgi:hypothetical protein